ncbi:hypothetical protein KFR76_00980 [Corynebacterium diphtheriae]|nr:hypothetical protein KFR76_00980 [Corynebacterium diphtheriae]
MYNDFYQATLDNYCENFMNGLPAIRKVQQLELNLFLRDMKWREKSLLGFSMLHWILSPKEQNDRPEKSTNQGTTAAKEDQP